MSGFPGSPGKVLMTEYPEYELEELIAMIQYLVDNWPGGCEDGRFTFPNGDYWPTSERKGSDD
jgi:hypothetical protein